MAKTHQNLPLFYKFSGLLGSQMQKQRLLNNQMNTHNLLLNNNQQQQPQNNRLLNSQFTQNQNIDDDLGKFQIFRIYLRWTICLRSI